MRYKPLLLALMLVFAAPVSYAKDAAPAKSSEVKKQQVKHKKEAAPSAKKEHAKDKAEVQKEKTAAKDRKTDKRGEKASETKKKDSGAKEAKSSVKQKNKAEEKKEEKKATTPARSARESEKSQAKHGKQNDKKEETKEKNQRKDQNKNERTAKRDEEDKRNKKHAVKEVKKETEQRKDKSEASKNTAKNHKQEAENVKKDDKSAKHDKKNTETKEAKRAKTDKNDKKNTAKTDSDELKAAVAAATNDVENKKTLLKQSEGLLVHVNTSLKQIQQFRNNLSGINRQQRDAWDKFQKLNADLNRLKTEVSNTKTQISRFVSGNYKNSQPNAVALFLKNAEPGQKTRFLRYTRYVNEANQKVIKDLDKQQKELAAQEQKINNELAYLKKIQSRLQASLRKQGVTNTAEQAESRKQNAKIAKDAQKIMHQKENEQRLNNLLNNLEKKKAEQRAQEAEAKKKAAEARLAAAEKAKKEAEARRAAMSNLTAEDMSIRAPSLALSNAGSFSRMQGRLHKPVNGTLTGLFGQDRKDGDTWKGVFYATAPADVGSIAAGTVTYADELDGYGKVVVVDHGENYISIYAGLSEIAVGKGYTVAPGNKVGVSGTLPGGEEGLYLQIRYSGQVMNPLSWIR